MEVKANLSFDEYRQGSIYQVDETDTRVAALLGVGYLSPYQAIEVDDGAVDTAGTEPVPGDSVAAGKAAPKRTRGRVKSNVAGAAESGEEGRGGAQGGGASGSSSN